MLHGIMNDKEIVLEVRDDISEIKILFFLHVFL